MTSDTGLYRLEYMMAQGDEVVAVVAEAASNRQIPRLSSSESALQHSKLYNLRSE